MLEQAINMLWRQPLVKMRIRNLKTCERNAFNTAFLSLLQRIEKPYYHNNSPFMIFLLKDTRETNVGRFGGLYGMLNVTINWLEPFCASQMIFHGNSPAMSSNVFVYCIQQSINVYKIDIFYTERNLFTLQKHEISWEVSDRDGSGIWTNEKPLWQRIIVFALSADYGSQACDLQFANQAHT